MSAWVRSGALTGVPELIAELGQDPDRLLRACGIEPAALNNPDTPVSVIAVAALLEEAAAACSCETFGLRLSQRQCLTLFGPMFPLFESAATIGRLLRNVVEFFPLHTKGALLAVQPAPGGVLVIYDVAAGVAASHRQVIELGFGILVQELQRRAPDWQPEEVFFRHSAPRDMALHRAILGRLLTFNADRNAVFVDAALLARPNTSGDPELHRALASKFDAQRKALAAAMRGQTEAVLRGLLPFADCDLRVVARILRTTPRTLQRKLAEDGASFGEIFDQVRADLAMSYLRDSALTVAEVAEILQFSETSALTRAFRRWYGISPRRARSQPSRPALPHPS